jgi:hypothetical protein
VVSLLVLLGGCSAFANVSRADAIEACEGAYRLFEQVPNPVAGQPIVAGFSETDMVRASDQEIDARFVAVRVATVRSNDRDLEEALPSLRTSMALFILLPSTPVGTPTEVINDALEEFGEQRSVFLGVCREKRYL